MEAPELGRAERLRRNETHGACGHPVNELHNVRLREIDARMDAGERLTSQTHAGTISCGMLMAAQQTMPITLKFVDGVTVNLMVRNRTMNASTDVVKDDEKERPVPNEWRPTFYDIVEALKSGDFKLETEIPNVKPLSDKEAQRISWNIQSYGSNLVKLPEESWDKSIYIWMEEYWEVLVDLFVHEGRSDLVLFTHVYEKGSAYEYCVQSVHVP